MNLALARTLWLRRASGRDLAFFTSQLALLLETGTSLTDALAALRAQTANAVLRQAIEEAEEDVREGKLLSSALGRHPRLFPSLLTSMVRVGETGGFLADSLQRTSEFLMLRQEVRSRIQAALAYPAILVVISLSVVLFLVTAVLPKFLKIFEGKEAILPLSTKLLMSGSHVLIHYWYLWVVAVFGAAAGITFALRSPAGKQWFDRWLLRLPVVGPLCRLTISSRVLRTLGVLLESGVPLLDAVTVTRQTLSNIEFGRFMDRLQQIVEQGGALSAAFLESPLFTPAIKQMVATGELSGSGGKVMIRMAGYYEGQVTLQLKSLTTAIEPIVLLLMGSVVGFIALSLFTPLFRMARAVS